MAALKAVDLANFIGTINAIQINKMPPVLGKDFS